MTRTTQICCLVVCLAVIAGIGLGLSGCGRKSKSAPQKADQSAAVPVETAPVTVGDISNFFTGTATLEAQDETEVVAKVGGVVKEILVEEGSYVVPGDVLAKLDDEKLAVQHEQAEANLKKLESEYERAQQLFKGNLISAQDSLNSIQDIKDAQDALAAAQNQQKIDEGMLKEAMLTGGGTGSTAVNFWNLTIAADKQKVADAQKTLNDVSSGTSASVASNANTQIALKQLAILQAQQKIVDTQNALDDANQAVKDAQKALDDAKATSTEIKSPFDGVVTVVSITPGAAIKKGAAAITVADTSKFQTDILVNEMDIPNVTVGTQATVQIEAMSGVTLSARVTTIAPISTNQSGVVTYKVTADLTSLAALQTPAALAAADPAQLAAAQQRLNDAIAKAVAAGQITQAQADAFKQRWSQIAANLTQDQLDQLIKAAGQRAGTGAAAGQGLGTDAITSLLRYRHQLLADGSEDDFTVTSIEQIMSTISSAINQLTLLLGAIAAISLLVGGIGVMNIMLVSVMERKREIGIRKALGARERDIWGQFLIEAALLTFTGGIIGVAFGWLASYFIQKSGLMPSLVTADVVVLAVSVAIGIGLFFGFYPAWQASRLNPIEALRAE